MTSRLEMIPTTVPSSSITGKCRNEFWRWACGAGRRVACGVWCVACGGGGVGRCRVEMLGLRC